MANLDLEKDFQVSTPAQSEINIQTPKGPAKAANLLSPSSNSSTNSHSSPNWCLRKKIFCLFLYVTVFTNFDTGVIPAALVNIHKELGLNYTQQGLLGSLPNFGISVASFLVSYLIGKFQTKRILTLAIIFNVAFCILFALSENLYALYVSRFFMGFTQAFWIIYGPVWTNYFSPHERQTTWLGFLQGFSPLGIIFGYLVTAIIINTWSVDFSWRLAILMQAGLEIPIIFILFFIKNSDLDMFEHKKLNDSSPALPIQNAWQQIKQLISNKLFLFACFCVCTAFFVVIGIQFWGTSYMIITMDTSPHNAMILYSFITITAPILGVITSGFLLDHLGGYKGNNKNIALKMMLACSIICLLIAIPTCFVFNIFLFGPLLWLEIFFGACNIPAGIGIVVDSVDSNLQAYASSFSQFIYNICGYFLSPIFSATIMDSFDDKVEGMKWGFRTNEFMCIFGVIFVICMMCVVEWPKKHHHDQKSLKFQDFTNNEKSNNLEKKFDEQFDTDME